MLSEDGSGRGAALVAAVLKRGDDIEPVRVIQFMDTFESKHKSTQKRIVRIEKEFYRSPEKGSLENQRKIWELSESKFCKFYVALHLNPPLEIGTYKC